MSKTVHFKRPALYRIVIFALWYGSGLWRIKTVHFKGRACTESSFLDFGTGPGIGEVQNGSFIKAALVQHRSFLSFGTGPGAGEPGSCRIVIFGPLALVPACQVMSRHIASRHVAS